MRNLEKVKKRLITHNGICEWEAMYRYGITPKELSDIITEVENKGFVMSKQKFFFDFEYNVIKINKN